MLVGEIEVIAVSDGTARMPAEFWMGFDWDGHPELLGPDGRIHMPIGCFVVRTRDQTVLLDAGLGPVRNDWADGGQLPSQLAAVGVAPADVDLVVCTHLHLDHAGWLVSDGLPFFPNATVRFGAGDWQQFVADAPVDDHIRRSMETLDRAGRLEPMEGDMVALAPGLTARFTPGHTLGHYSLVLSSGAERALLLGDAVECPLQIDEDDFSAMSDVDPEMARRTREAVWREIEGTGALVGAAHFPGLDFGRLVAGQGRRWEALG